MARNSGIPCMSMMRSKLANGGYHTCTPVADVQCGRAIAAVFGWNIAGILCRLAGAPMPTYRPFPRERAIIDIGSFVTNSRRYLQDLGWRPDDNVRGRARPEP